ncbi:D-amino-acid dehydrogenase [Evansella caseinilytica]|uniref:D-amino-acid dehydrogenase n=1 Tax=Evansella caseinilytica TaxID=1503961 RepID=A0A1H3UMU1_9BACI|nr:FAD-binding oxidoreductase [Evansella caseinilytica]SDZ63740.1 D-amino-acid dehydrogenase [Evansella caseinilytica]
MDKYIVIGAGILGASTAYQLAKAGADVVLVDRRDSGQATEAAAGIVCPWLSQRRNKAWYRLAKNGAEYYPTLVRELELLGEENTGYARVGAIRLHTDEKKLEDIEARAIKRQEEAPEIGRITRLSSSETTALFPPLASRYRSVYISGGARVDGRAIRDALIRGATKLGAVFLPGNAALVSRQNRVIGIKTNDTFIEADHIIITAGVWIKELLQPLGVNISVSPQKGQIVHLLLPDSNTSHWPVVMPPNNQYLLASEDGRIIIGTTHEDEAGFDGRVTAGGVHEILSKALDVAPGLSTGTLLETRAGFRPVTPGFLPVIGQLPQNKNVFLANGLGASGLTAGPYLGAELAKLALGKETDIRPDDYAIAGALENH